MGLSRRRKDAVDHLGHRLNLLVHSRVRHARQQLESFHRAHRRAVIMRVMTGRAALERLAGHLDRVRPQAVLADRHELVAVLEHRLDRAIRRRRDRVRVLSSKASASVCRRKRRPEAAGRDTFDMV